jgi:hypothetical protein
MLKHALRLVLFGGAVACGTTAVAEVPGGETRVHHVVIVWLKDAGNPAAREQYIAQSRRLSKLPMVIDYRIGTALPGGREIVDSTYDVAVVSTFANRQAVTAYMEHPEHKEVIEQALKPLVAKAVVYDFAEVP